MHPETRVKLKRHLYRFLHGGKFQRGTQWRLRRDDGKLVWVSRQRLNRLVNEHRIVEKLPYETAVQS